MHEERVALASEAALVRALGKRSIVLVGMMGAGKSSIGRRLAARLGIPFVDADAAETLRKLMAERDPIYAQADAIVHSREVPHETIVGEILAALADRLELGSAGNSRRDQPS